LMRRCFHLGIFMACTTTAAAAGRQ
jgi:hypothetical protein